MADVDDHRDTWGNTVAHWTFLCTVGGAILFVASVFVFILLRT